MTMNREVLYRRFRTFIGVGLLSFGSMAVLKTLQDARYLKKDLRSISNTELSETDLEVYRDKYKLSDKDMTQILNAAKEKKKARIENEYENNPNFVHKRAPRPNDE